MCERYELRALAYAARDSSGNSCAVPVVFVSHLNFVISPQTPRPVLPSSELRAAMALAGANLLARRCSLWRSACRPLMLAAMGQPRVTQDPSRNGQVTIEPADAACHTATFVGPIHGLGDTNQGWLGAAMHLHAQMPHVKFVLPNAPTMPVRSTWLGSGWVRVGLELKPPVSWLLFRKRFCSVVQPRVRQPRGRLSAAQPHPNQPSPGDTQHGYAYAVMVRHHLPGRPRQPAVVRPCLSNQGPGCELNQGPDG